MIQIYHKLQTFDYHFDYNHQCSCFCHFQFVHTMSLFHRLGLRQICLYDTNHFFTSIVFTGHGFGKDYWWPVYSIDVMSPEIVSISLFPWFLILNTSSLTLLFFLNLQNPRRLSEFDIELFVVIFFTTFIHPCSTILFLL